MDFDSSKKAIAQKAKPTGPKQFLQPREKSRRLRKQQARQTELGKQCLCIIWFLNFISKFFVQNSHCHFSDLFKAKEAHQNVSKYIFVFFM